MINKSLLGNMAHLDRKLRALIERRILSSKDVFSARRMWLASLYMQWRCLALKKAVRSGLWISSGLRVIISLALNPGDTFFDIGANVGWVTQPAAWLVGRRGSVHSFEPSPTTIGYLRRRLVCMDMSNVVVNQFALGAVLGAATLYECVENYGGSSSLRPGAAPGQHLSTETPVAIRVLDDYVEQNSISQIRLIKIDAQGAEIDVLRGAARLLAPQNRPVLYVEIEQIANAAFGYSVNDLLNVLRGMGYDLFSWREIGLVNVKSEKDLPAGGHDDVICLSPGIHDVLHNQLEHLAQHPRFRIVSMIE
jgi:FkbM family methyltransferase